MGYSIGGCFCGTIGDPCCRPPLGPRTGTPLLGNRGNRREQCPSGKGTLCAVLSRGGHIRHTEFGFFIIALVGVTLSSVQGPSAAGPKDTPTGQAAAPSPAVKPMSSTASVSGGDVATADRTAEPTETPALATPAGSATSSTVEWQSVNGGGAIDAASPAYKLGSSAGQSTAGAATSTSYQMGIGFWYGGGCSCPCHGHPQCDGITNVQEAVQTVNVAFRGGAGL